MLIDTHAHLDYTDYDPDREEVLARAHSAGVTEVISIGTRIDSSTRAVALAATYPSCWATVGIHPCDVGSESLAQLDALSNLAQQPRVVAIGEIGLDYHRLPSQKEADPHSAHALSLDQELKKHQAAVFRAQLTLAAELGLNVVIHQRDSWEDTLAIVKEFTGRVRGVYHCFGGTREQAETLFALGHLVSFTGIVTFKNGDGVRETARTIPLDRFMVETDCPYLAPTPHRGKRCEPAHTRLIADQIAFVRGIKVEDLAQATTATARNFFRFR